MRQKLQDAIVATRAGNTREAQLLLTDILKEDPNETQAWFLLSNLVESEDKKMAYLGKVLALDPSHNKAAQQLAYLQTQTAVADKTPPPPLSTPEPEEDEIDWLADSNMDTADVPDDPDEAMAWLSSLAEEATQPAMTLVDEDINEDDSSAMDWLEETKTPEPATATIAEPVAKDIVAKTATEVTTTKSSKQTQIEQYDRYMRYLMIFIGLLIVILLIMLL